MLRRQRLSLKELLLKAVERGRRGKNNIYICN